MTAFLRRAWALVALLFACTTTSATERHTDLTEHLRDVGTSATSTRDVETRDVEQGPSIEVSCEGRADDCARALLDALATQPPEAEPPGEAHGDLVLPRPMQEHQAPPEAGWRPSGTVKVTRKVTLPIGTDPRLPPLPGPAAPAVRESEHIDRSASSTAAGEKDSDKHDATGEHATHKTDIGLSWQVKLALVAGALLVLFLLYRFTGPGRALAALIGKD